MTELILADPAATERLGQVLGKLLQSGDVVCFTGDLGAGKTHCCRAIAMSLGVPAGDVTSPTFTLMNVYQGDVEIRHFDFYRLQREEELADIGFDEYCGGDGITLIEWAELFPESLPEEYLQINLQRPAEGRKAALEPHGSRYVQLLKEFENAYLGH